MLDNASTSNFITSTCANRLKLARQNTHVNIQGLGGAGVGKSKGKVQITFCSYLDHSISFTIEAFIVNTISKLPSSHVDASAWDHINKLSLADPKFYCPAAIDILVGAEIYYEIVGGDKKMHSRTEPFAIQSKLGWLIGGGRNQTSPRSAIQQSMMTSTGQSQTADFSIQQQSEQLEGALKRFWEIEACPAATKLSNEDQYCEKYFHQTYTRNTEGRFIVKYPFKQPRVKLGESLSIAVRRLKQVERRLSKNDKHKKDYLNFMQEYEALGHMVEIEPPSSSSNFRCYLPHHFVLKESSTTTKFRVVFDASAKTSNGNSLNDTMYTGPSIQDKIFGLITRFRKHNIAFTADIEKMYRQILISPEEQELQHIVWRESPDQPLKHFKLLTVTYGTAAGPYLATKVLQVLSQIEEINYPIGSKVLREDMYVDDCMSGGETDEDVIEIQQQLIDVLGKAKMSIRKFTSNSEKVLQSLPEDLRETKSLTIDKEASVKALGIFWNPSGDYFGFKPENIFREVNEQPTKRNILSEISKLFDPIGWLAPVIINAKILMQDIWKEKIDWDEIVPASIAKKWTNFKSELTELQKLKIPRKIGYNSNLQHTYLVGYSDASEKAYCATIFLCSYDPTGKPEAHLIASKTRVAPVQTQSLPRLELCGAQLLAEFIPSVVDALKIKLNGIYAYTDSTLVLHWVKAEPYRFNTFVGNRISKIQNHIKAGQWGFVSGIDNPADCGSRGITASEFVNHKLWWTGSSWLTQKPPTARLPPESSKDFQPAELGLRKTTICHATTIKDTFDIFSKFSTLSKLQRVTVFIFRFFHNCRVAVQRKSAERCEHKQITSPWISSDELRFALHRLIAIAQEQEFVEDLQNLKKERKVQKKSKILSLAPFLDQHNILRVGGRLRHAKVPLNQKHPILLPQHHEITKLIVQEAHITNLHAGPQALLSYLQQRYWIVRGKDAIRTITRKCIVCTKLKAETMQQIMADLPSFRINKAFPFEQCGIDYCGPFLFKPIAPRSKTTLKAYICIFICCATRAIHLEVVSSANTSAFLAALRRFTSRRGKPSDIYSDNGTNFVGANRELKEFLGFMKSDKLNQDVAETISRDGIKWHFNPPAAPHFGGLWEAGVKSTKYHLSRVMGLSRLTFEELNTLTTQIEAILNSRPLTPESNDPSDLRALSPGHFLIGRPLTAVPDADVTSISIGRLGRWQLIQQITQQFWKRWSAEYITRLQQRPKWLQPKEPIKEGSMVIVKEDNLPPLQWKLARVIQLHPGTDNHVRTVTVRTSSGEYKRPIVKLCLLPVEISTTSEEV